MMDARFGAWMKAWELMEGIDRHVREAQHLRVEPEHEALRRAREYAAVYAQLACASPEVGLTCGDLIQREEQRKAEVAQLFAESRSNKKSKTEPAKDDS